MSENRRTKWLCICAGGNVRSAAIAFRLKDLGHDAVPIGLVYNSRSLLFLLCDWAEKIWIAESNMIGEIPLSAQSKVVNQEGDYTGPDIWGLCMHPDLAELSSRIVNRLNTY